MPYCYSVQCIYDPILVLDYEFMHEVKNKFIKLYLIRLSIYITFFSIIRRRMQVNNLKPIFTRLHN